MSGTAEVLAGRFEVRAARAAMLAAHEGPGAAPLRLAAALFRAQGQAASALAREPLSGSFADDAARVLPVLRRVLGALREGPPQLAAEAEAADALSDAELGAALQEAWSGSPGEDYVARALLRPYAEALVELELTPARPRGEGACPRCGGAPWVGARRALSGAEAAQRSMSCALCGHEYAVPRIVCLGCGEHDPHKLPTFSDPSHAAVRLEACESCRRYVKTLDLTQDARPLPEVDDLCSLPLDLWAQEQGWTRLEPGLAGV